MCCSSWGCKESDMTEWLIWSIIVCAWVLSHFSHVWLLVTIWTVALQASLSMGFSRQEYWNGLPCSPPGDLPDPRIDPASFVSPTLAGELFTTTWEACITGYIYWNCLCLSNIHSVHIMFRECQAWHNRIYRNSWSRSHPQLCVCPLYPDLLGSYLIEIPEIIYM